MKSILQQWLRTSLVAGALVPLGGTAALAAPDGDTGTDDQPPVKQGAGFGAERPGWEDTIRTLKKYGHNRKEEVVAAARQAMREADRRIDRLEKLSAKKLSHLSAGAKAEQREAMGALRQHRAEFSAWVARLEESSESAWNETRNNFAADYKRLGRALENMTERLHTTGGS